MHTSNDRHDHRDRSNIADDVPVADAVEQEQETTLEPPAPDSSEPPEPPMEAAGPDWQEQRQEVVGTDDDREAYPAE